MRPLIFFLLFFYCACANAQGRFVQTAYVRQEQDGDYFGRVTDRTFIFFIYNDTTVKIEVQTTYYLFMRNQSFDHIIIGKGKLNGDTLSIIYTSFSSTQTANKQLKLRRNYISAPKERIFYPPTVFVISGESIRDLNNDFPVLNKVSPAVAMNIPQPK